MHKQTAPEGAKCERGNLHSTEKSQFQEGMLAALLAECSIGNSTEAQRFRLLDALLNAGDYGVSTIQAREELDVMAPAARVFELRTRFGYNIQTRRSSEINAQGCQHLCACYVLSLIAKSEVSR